MTDWKKRQQEIRERLRDYPYSLKDFARNDRVSFSFDDEIIREGIIFMIDSMGTDECYRICPSFDILIEEENMVYKHVPMVYVTKK